MLNEKEILPKKSGIAVRDNHRRNSLWAAKHGRMDILKWLIENGIPIDLSDTLGNEAIHCATHGGHQETIQWLVEHGASIHARDAEGAQPLHIAAHYGFLEIAQWLLENGADIHASDEYGQQAIHWTARGGSLKLVELLVAWGANIRARAHGDIEPLLLASRAGNLFIVQLLIQRGASINARTNRGIEPIHYAAAGGNLLILQLLVELGAHIDSPDNDSRQPTHWAAHAGQLSAIRWLVAHGADISAQTTDGQTATTVAHRNGHDYIITWLTESIGNFQEHDTAEASSSDTPIVNNEETEDKQPPVHQLDLSVTPNTQIPGIHEQALQQGTIQEQHEPNRLSDLAANTSIINAPARNNDTDTRDNLLNQQAVLRQLNKALQNSPNNKTVRDQLLASLKWIIPSVTVGSVLGLIAFYINNKSNGGLTGLNYWENLGDTTSSPVTFSSIVTLISNLKELGASNPLQSWLEPHPPVLQLSRLEWFLFLWNLKAKGP